MKNTAGAGKQNGKLFKLAGKVLKLTLRRRLYELMLEKKVASLEVEVEAYMLNMEREGRGKAKRKDINWGFMRKNRSWLEVEDILRLEMKRKKRTKKFRKMIDKLKRNNDIRWKKGL